MVFVALPSLMNMEGSHGIFPWNISVHEETPETLLFRGFSEEFSYENVNLYKGNCLERILRIHSLYSM